MKNQDLRTSALIGEEALLKLKNSCVAVFGLGGVGSYVVESLVRSGVGTLYLYDNDVVSESNINRQLVALHSTVGLYKTDVAKKRAVDINPDVRIIENRVFVTDKTEIPFLKFDYIVDAIDNVTAKLFLVSEAEKADVPIISIMGTGNKLNPLLLKVTDIYKTSACPLARVMRAQLKKRGIKHLTTVWSSEIPVKSSDCGEYRSTGRVTPGSMSMVPGTAGLIAASQVITNLCNKHA